MIESISISGIGVHPSIFVMMTFLSVLLLKNNSYVDDSTADNL